MLKKMLNMKKFLIFTIAAALVLCSCSASKIAVNTHSKGVRTVLTSSRSVFGDIKVALGARSVDAKDTVLAIVITSTKESEHGLFDSGDALQLRLADDSVITLTNILDKEYDKETTTTVTNLSPSSYYYYYGPYYDMIPVTTTSTTTSSYALYLVTGEQIADIIGKGIVKARIECEQGYIPVPNPVRLRDIITNELNDLKNAFFNDPKADRDEF